MDTFEEKLFDMAKNEAPEVPAEVMGRVRAELNALPEGRRAGHGLGWRPARVALAAALAVVLLTGTALAASPALRELLWGGFEPYVQELESTAENTQIYDGVEFRIVSALSDGAVNILHLEVRDTAGDRVREAWERYRGTGENEFLEHVNLETVVDLERSRQEAGRDAPFSQGFTEASTGAVPMGFQEETGVMTLRITRITAAPLEMGRQVELTIDSGLFGTELMTQEHSSNGDWTHTVTVDGEIVIQESGHGSTWTETLPGWTLSAELTPLPSRTVEVPGIRVEPVGGDVLDNDLEPVTLPDASLSLTEVRVSQLGITLCWDPAGELDNRQSPESLTVTLKDGGSFTVSGPDANFSARFHRNGGNWKSTSWLLPEPLDPDSVASLTLGGVEISLD